MNPPLYLGRSVYDGRPHTRIEPLARAEEGAWRAYAVWDQVFPPEGLVFAPTRPRYPVGVTFAFNVQPNTREAGAHKDEWLMGDFEPVPEVVDYRGVDRETARRAVVEAPAPPPRTTSTQLVIALSGHACVVLPRAQDGRDGWRYDVPDYKRLPLRALDERLFSGDKTQGAWLAVPGVTVGAPIGYVDWCSDADLLEAGLKKLRKLAAAGGPEPPFKRAQIASIVSYLARVALLPEHAAEFGALRERLPSFVDALQSNTEALDEAISAILAIDGVDVDVKAEVESRRALHEAEFRSSIERRVEVEFAERQAEALARQGALWEEIERLEEEVNRLRREETGARSAVEAFGAAWRREAADARASLSGLDGATPFDLTAATRRVEAEADRSGRAFRLFPPAAPCWAGVATVAAEPASEWAEFEAALAQAAAFSGFEEASLRAADVGARGGALVVLPEAVASVFVRAYARIVCGGALRRQALDPAVLGPDDLWRLAPTGVPTSLAWAWTAAEDDAARYVVLLLEGLERTAADLWLPPFLERLQAADRPSNLLVFSTLGERWYDRGRSACLNEHACVAPIAPAEPAGVTPEALAGLLGSAPPRSVFSPSAALSPDQGAAVAGLNALASEPFASRRRAVQLLRAAWVHSNRVDPTHVVRAALGGTPTNDPICNQFASGRAWLRRAATSSSAS